MLTRCGLALLSVLVLLFPSPASAAEEKPPAAPDVADVLSISTYPQVSRQVAAAQALLEARDWKKAIALLQPLLDRKDDVLIEVKIRKPEGRTTSRIMSARVEAIRLLEAMPEEGQEVYLSIHGPAAYAALAELGKLRDARNLLEVTRHYPITRIGWTRDAAARLAREDVIFAAPLIERWVENTSLGGDFEALIEAGMALRRSRSPAYGKVERELLRRLNGDTKKLERALEKRVRDSVPSPNNWLIWGGDASRCDPAPAFLPKLEPKLDMPLVEDRAAKLKIEEALGAADKNGRTILPPGTTIGMTVVSPRNGDVLPIVYFITHKGLKAVNVQTLKRYYESPMEWSLERTLGEPRYSVTVSSWFNRFVKNGRSDVLLENTMTSALSSDGRLIFAVDDLQVRPEIRDEARDRKLQAAMRHNALKAYGAFDGKFRWIAYASGSQDNEDQDGFFLGPPLPLANWLYVLTQKEGALRLLTLDSTTGKLIATYPLGSLRETLLDNPVRRTHAVHLAYGDGVVVCPTNAGVVFGVDVIDGGLRWIYPYQAKKTAPALAQDEAPALAESYWKLTEPMIADGKVVFAAPDSPTIHCVNLRDGTRVWALHQQKDDLYLAGVSGDRVLIAGKTGLRAVSVAKGATLWTAPVGLPSGHGVIGTDGRYYLPVAATAKEKKPGVVAIDIANGTLAAAAIADDGKVPGNLMFFNDLMVSQTVTELTVYSR